MLTEIIPSKLEQTLVISCAVIDMFVLAKDSLFPSVNLVTCTENNVFLQTILNKKLFPSACNRHAYREIDLNHSATSDKEKIRLAGTEHGAVYCLL